MNEMERIKQNMERLREVSERHKAPTLNRGVAKKIYRNAMFDPADPEASKRRRMEGGEEEEDGNDRGAFSIPVGAPVPPESDNPNHKRFDKKGNEKKKKQGGGPGKGGNKKMGQGKKAGKSPKGKHGPGGND